MRPVSIRRYRHSLTVTARHLVDVGWPVIPGAWWAPLRQRHCCDLAGCRASGLHPAPVGCHDGAVCAPGHVDLARYVLNEAGQVDGRWAHRPYAVLVVTGLVVDALDAPASLARDLVTAMTALRLPTVAATVGGRGLIFMAAGRAVDPDRAVCWNSAGVVCHQRGSWTAVPPSVTEGRPARWFPGPPWTSCQLPEPDDVLPLLDHLARSSHRRSPTTAASS